MSRGEYFEVHPTSPWNYGLLQQTTADPEKGTAVKMNLLQKGFRWNLANAPIEIKAKQINDWKAINGLAYLPVSGRDGIYKGCC